jgi:hypothetical protein
VIWHGFVVLLLHLLQGEGEVEVEVASKSHLREISILFRVAEGTRDEAETNQKRISIEMKAAALETAIGLPLMTKMPLVECLIVVVGSTSTNECSG